MRWKFAFGLASDDLFFVTTRRILAPWAVVPLRSKVTTFPDEDEFLGHLMRAGLGEEQTARLARAVLLSVAKPESPPPWIELDLTPEQMEMLHLSDAPALQEDWESPQGKDLYLQAARSGSLPEFYDLLMQAPMAIAMLIGPEHRFTFFNVSFMELVGANSAARMMGKTLSEVFPELFGERSPEIIRRVYQTGRTHHGTEEKRAFYRERTGRVEEGYFNTVCQPICNAFGDVAGVMLQCTDVTEMVLAREVRENREQLLFNQWAELDAIYRSAPVAMMLIDAKDFRIQRLNEKQAELLGRSAAELLGRPLLEVASEPAELSRMLHQVLRGGPVKEYIVEGAPSLSPGSHRYWLKSCAPTLSPAGKVESIILVGLEISRETRADLETVALGELEVMV